MRCDGVCGKRRWTLRDHSPYRPGTELHRQLTGRMCARCCTLALSLSFDDGVPDEDELAEAYEQIDALREQLDRREIASMN